MPTGNGLHEPRDVCRELHAGHVLEPSRGSFLVRCGEDLRSGWENVEFCSRISGAESDLFGICFVYIKSSFIMMKPHALRSLDPKTEQLESPYFKVTSSVNCKEQQVTKLLPSKIR